MHIYFLLLETFKLAFKMIHLTWNKRFDLVLMDSSQTCIQCNGRTVCDDQIHIYLLTSKIYNFAFE